MVGASDLKVYRSTSNLGGAITGTQIQNGNPNNLFINVNRSDQVSGEDFYKCCFFKNAHATESMDNFKLWLTSKTQPNDTEIKWGYDSVAKKSIFLDGTDDYIQCGNDATLWSTGLTKFSISIWVYFNADALTTDRYVVSHGNTTNLGFRFIRRFSDQKLLFQLKDNVGGLPNAIANSAPANKKWYNIVGTYDSTLGTQNIKFYVNSVLQTDTGDMTQTVNLSDELTIGTEVTANAPSCYVKDFRFWKTKALTQTEVNNVYAESADDNLATRLAPTPNYWLEMNDWLLTNPEDKITHTKTGVLTGGAAYAHEAQIIADTFTAPSDVDWLELGPEPSAVRWRTVTAGMHFPIWIWYHVNANAAARLDDSELFAFKFDIPQGGTGSGGGGGGDGGGGGGGNPPPVNADYKIAFAGDWGCESETDDVIDLVKTGGYNALIGVGDNAYASPDCWISRFNSVKSIFLGSAYGNHEYSESGGTGPYKTFFGDNLTYYTFKYQNIFFIIIDSNINMDEGSAQHTALKNALLASLNDNTITWRIGIIHFPWFGADSDHSYDDGQSVEAFHELFQNNKVNFVVAGHNHNFQRTFQVSYNSGDPENPNVVASANPYSATKKAIMHIVTGTGGHDSGSSLYSLGSQPAFQAYQNRTHNGIWEIVASNNAQTLTCSFVDKDGSKFDTITMTAT